MTAQAAPRSETGAETETGAPAKGPRRQQFPKRFVGPKLTPEAAERQGRVTQLAWRLLGGRDGAIAFLNAHDDSLGGRPLDLAVASEAACLAVEQAIERHAKQQHA